jgi:hypothetical protein
MWTLWMYSRRMAGLIALLGISEATDLTLLYTDVLAYNNQQIRKYMHWYKLWPILRYFL